MAELGLEIKAFTIKELSDNDNYLVNLGRPRVAQVKRDADIAQAEAQKETHVKTSQAYREGEAAKILAETQIAESNKEKELKVQAYRKDQESAKAISDLAYQIESNKVQKEVTETQMQVEILRKQKERELADENMKIELVKKEREIELATQESLRKERELEATIKK